MDVTDFRTVHAIPGRTRLKIGALRGNPGLARELESRLGGEPGIRAVEANPATGSLLVRYDVEAPGWRDHTRVLGDALHAVTPDVDTARIAEQLATMPAPANGAVGIEGHQVMEFFRGLDEQVKATAGGPGLKLLVPFALVLLGVRGILTSDTVATPRWYDFLWFGFATFLMLNAAGVPAARAAEEAVEVASAL